MKMKKLIAVLMVIGMTAALMSACGGSSDDTAEEGPKKM